MSNGTHQTHVFPTPVTDNSISERVVGEGLLLLGCRCLGAGISLIILCYFQKVVLVCSLAVKQILLRAVAALDSLPWVGNARGCRAAAAPEQGQRHSQAGLLQSTRCKFCLWCQKRSPSASPETSHLFEPITCSTSQWVTVLSPAFLGTLAGDLMWLDTRSSYQPSLALASNSPPGCSCWYKALLFLGLFGEGCVCGVSSGSLGRWFSCKVHSYSVKF